MRKNKIKSIFIFMMLFLGLLFSFATIPVVSDSVYSLDYGWECNDCNDGVSNVTSNLFETQWVNTDYDKEFQVTNNFAHDGIKSFWIDGQKYDVFGYWNLTTTFNYISNISI